jgi:effector-binding domain-containing protein
MLALRRAELERQVRSEQARLAAVEARLGQIEREGVSAEHDVVVRSVPQLLVASIRSITLGAETVERLFEEVEAFAAQHGARAAAPPLAVYYDTEYRERDIDLEVAVPLTRVVESCGRVVVRELPGVEAMACVVHSGSYATLDAASGALYSWIASQGYRAAGPYREVYLRFGAGGLRLAIPGAYLADDSADYLTMLQSPVERGEYADQKEEDRDDHAV